MQGKGLRVTDLDAFAADVPSQQLQLAPDFQTAYMRLSQAERANTAVLLCVKGGATSAAAAEIAACAEHGTTVVSFQNGVENVTRIQAAATHVEALAGMVPYNVVMKTDAHVHRATADKLQLQSSENQPSLLHDLSLQASRLALQTT
jgi:2-dehydropantoate 2-reductase